MALSPAPGDPPSLTSHEFVISQKTFPAFLITHRKVLPYDSWKHGNHLNHLNRAQEDTTWFTLIKMSQLNSRFIRVLLYLSVCLFTYEHHEN